MLRIENDMGEIILDDNVITNIVSLIATNCFGIAGMAAKNVSEEIWSLFKKDTSDRGIQVRCENDEIYIDLHIMVTYGINIPAITESIVHKVSYGVEESTGFKVSGVNIYIDDIQSS